MFPSNWDQCDPGSNPLGCSTKMTSLPSKFASCKIITGIWIASVLAFSFLYWAAWLVRPDSFILNKEFNLTPYEQLLAELWPMENDAMWEIHAASLPAATTDLDEFSMSVAEIDREATAAQVQLAILRADQDKLEIAERAVYEEYSAKLGPNVERYKAQATKQETLMVERATTVAEALASASASAPSPNAALAAANAKVDVAKAKYSLAVRQAEVADYVMQHLRELADPDTTAKLDELKSKLAQLREQQFQLTEKLATIRLQAFSKLEDWYSKRAPRLQWIDFLYFSVGVSTTTTFGDIVPNSRTIRVAVLIQLVLSVFVVGYLVSLLSSGNRVS